MPIPTNKQFLVNRMMVLTRQGVTNDHNGASYTCEYPEGTVFVVDEYGDWYVCTMPEVCTDWPKQARPLRLWRDYWRLAVERKDMEVDDVQRKMSPVNRALLASEFKTAFDVRGSRKGKII